MTTSIQHTQVIFEHLCSDIPPSVPKEIREDIAQAREQVRSNVALTLVELEDTMTYIGKLLWPYREAFQEFFRVYEGDLGEQYLLRKFTPEMKRKYQTFKENGGTFRDLHAGTNVSFFTPDERVKVCEALIGVEEEIRAYAVQAILSTDERRYEKRVEEFKKILEDMENRLNALRTMADMEGEHPELAAEIREQIRGFEQGFALLGPKVRHDAVCNAEGHFQERKLVKKLRQRV
jgi:hypothetical protein